MTVLKGSEHCVLRFGLLGFRATPLPYIKKITHCGDQICSYHQVMSEEAPILLGSDRKAPLVSSRDRWVDNIIIKLVENFFNNLDTMSFPRKIQHHEVSWYKMQHNIHNCQCNAVNFGYNVKVVKFRSTVRN